MTTSKNSFSTEESLTAAGENLKFHSLKKYSTSTGKDLSKLPFSLKILLENLLRTEDEIALNKEDINAVADWDAKAKPSKEIQFMPARILLQDFTGVPAVADLAAMRAAIKKLGGNPDKINPHQPADLVIDHSVQVDYFGSPDAQKKNAEIEYTRNRERYEFLRWGQSAFENFRVVPPDTGIVHQVNLECLAHVAMTSKGWVYPDSLVGTDSHSTMINGLGVLGWGVGGIEAEAAMLGQPITMLIPNVVGFKLTGALPAGTNATDLVLTVVEILRKKGVVGKFVEFFGPGLANLTLADRATIANMAPEYGATCGIFPVDEKTIDYLNLTGREKQAQVTEAYYKAQDMWYRADTPEATYSDEVSLDMSSVETSLAGPSRPQDRVPLSAMASSFDNVLPTLSKGLDRSGENKSNIKDGSVVIAAITSCTNTSNPAGLVLAGLLAKKANERGLKSKPWVKTSLAPGSQVVQDYLTKAGLLKHLEALNFHIVGFGCTTCIGNSGPLDEEIQMAIEENGLVVSSVLSGNRNFEGRINPKVRSNYLASPALVVAYAIAGSVTIDISKDPIGTDKDGKPVFLKDVWPSDGEVSEIVSKNVTSEQFKKSYADVFKGDEAWQKIKYPDDKLYQWDKKSTYIKEPPFFDGMTASPSAVTDISGARVLLLLKDSVTTDHISPAGSFAADSPAGKYLIENGVDPKDFNSFGSRRGNHEVMLRGTFANVRIKNQLAPGTEGGFTRYLPTGEQTSVYEAAMKYQKDKTPLIVLAGKEYGTGSSRDWAAKGTLLLGVRAVITESFERIHRSNLIGMGVLPLQFVEGKNAESLALNGEETFDILGLSELRPGANLKVSAKDAAGKTTEFEVLARIDTPNELEYFRHGGILQYVLRGSLKSN